MILCYGVRFLYELDMDGLMDAPINLHSKRYSIETQTEINEQNKCCLDIRRLSVINAGNGGVDFVVLLYKLLL